MRLLGGAQPDNPPNLYVYEHNINTLGSSGNDEAAPRHFLELPATSYIVDLGNSTKQKVTSKLIKL